MQCLLLFILPQTKVLLNRKTPPIPQKKRKTQKVQISGENAEAVITVASAKVLMVNDNRLPILIEPNK